VLRFETDVSLLVFALVIIAECVSSGFRPAEPKLGLEVLDASFHLTSLPPALDWVGRGVSPAP